MVKDLIGFFTRKRKVKNSITAPRILAYTSFGQGEKNGINNPEEAINGKKVDRGADGINFLFKTRYI